MTPRRVAVIHDWLDTWGGGESVLAEILRAYPHADLFTLVDFFNDDMRRRLGGKHARTSFLQRIPGVGRRFRALLPLFPRAIESFDLSAYDLVLSSSHAVAKGVRTTKAQLHVCYCHTPMRYAWDLRDDYLGPRGLSTGWRGAIANRVLDRLRDWDRASSSRVDRFIANSAFVRDRIQRSYARDATVIHPPVDTEFFEPAMTAVSAPPYYFTASRHVPYKRIDLIAAAFKSLPSHRLVIAGAGPETARIRAAAGPNVEFVGEVPRAQLRTLLQGAQAFIFAAEEDFGILPVEAQACGTPVIALRRGGTLETVRGLDGAEAPTGVFFDEQSVPAIANAVLRFETHASTIATAACRANALEFSTPRFQAQYTAFVEAAWGEFAGGRR
jgi:glycosyltransferase involved in cell wall biosynthesis